MPTLVVSNRARLAQLPANVQAAVAETMTEATAAQRRYAAEDDVMCLATLEADGVEVIRPDGFDRAAFVEAVANIRTEAMRAAGMAGGSARAAPRPPSGREPGRSERSR